MGAIDPEPDVREHPRPPPVGGYPVVKKWLSYREKRVLGRALKMEEMTYITEVVRRLKALLLLGPELDANYRACANDTIELGK